MPTFNTNLELGAIAFAVRGHLDPYIEKLTVGQVRITRMLPNISLHESEGVYKEEYMCVETGVGSGIIWEYGKNIFKIEEDAQRGVIKQQQRAYKERAKRDEYQKRKREDDLRLLKDLKEKYELTK